MCFAYSKRPLEKVRTTFTGEWKYLNKALFIISEERAEKACLELALFLRMLDDDEKLSASYANTGAPNCGRLIMKDKPEEVLTFREFANKVIHASNLEWKLSEEAPPLLICHSRDEEKWIRADVDIIAIAAVCGQLVT